MMDKSNFNCGMLQKVVLTTLVNCVTSFKNSTKKRKQQSYVASRLDMLEENMRVARQYHEAIVGGGRLEGDLKLEELVIVYEQIQEIYLEYRSDLLEALEKFSQPTPAASATSGESAASSNKIRLREIDIPKFSGSYTTWRSFQGLFQSMVHNNASLNDVDKMHYLKSCLQGEAERLLQHLPCDAGNYATAWDLLTSRYDHKRVLVNAQLKLLIGQSSLSKESANGLKELLDTSQECVHSLANLGLLVEHWDAILIFVLLHKLPNSTQQLWEEKLGNSKELPTYKQFTGFLETRFRTLEVVDQQDLKGSSRPWVRGDTTVNTRNRSYAEAPRVLLAKTSPRETISCKLCHQGQHAMRKCQRFLNLNPIQRKQTIRNVNVCENCLGYSHNVHDCPSIKCCYFCQQRHHSLLHVHDLQTNFNNENSNYNNNNNYHNNNNNGHINQNSNFPSQQPRSSNAQSNQVRNAPVFRPSEEPQPSTSSQINTFYSLSQRSKVLLATAMVRVRSSDGRFHNLRALIDPGSEATFISESAAELLRLKSNRTIVEVSGLGMVSSGIAQNYVDITFASKHSTFVSTVKAFVFKSLTGLLPTQQMIPDKWQHLSGLHLADPDFYVPAPVDLLFGSDVFAEILLPDIVRSEGSVAPIAQKTRLGWIIFGKVPAENPQHVRNFAQFTDQSFQLQTISKNEEKPNQIKDPEEVIVRKYKIKSLSNGNYRLSLPLKQYNHLALTSSKESADHQFSLEKRFVSNPKLQAEDMEELDLVRRDDGKFKKARLNRSLYSTTLVNLFCWISTCIINAKIMMQQLFYLSAHHDWNEVACKLANLGTEWHLFPPASPHFRGLWEAGVKSVKYQFKRIFGNERLTYEELNTLLKEIETCPNSRPLCPLSDNVDDLEIITPAHLLIGEPFHTIPQGDNTLRKIGYLDRWKRLQSFLDSFWHKWNTEYLSRLQQRPKWLKAEEEPRIGDLVLIKDERLPPSHWSLARIHQTHPGTDGLTRVVTVKTKTGFLKRPIAKICYLPTNKNNEDDTLI